MQHNKTGLEREVELCKTLTLFIKKHILTLVFGRLLQIKMLFHTQTVWQKQNKVLLSSEKAPETLEIIGLDDLKRKLLETGGI